jgi:hypothetical protein
MQEGLQIGTSEIIINGSTTLQPHHHLPSSFAASEVKKMKESTAMSNHDPRMNRKSSIVLIELTPNIARC